MAGTKKSNYMINFIISTIKGSTSKELFHTCPYEGKVDVSNVTLQNEKFFSIYPSGKYRINIKISDEKNVEMISVTMGITLTT